jgi:hypothetical protein
MDYSAPAGSRWKLAPGSLTSGSDHLCTGQPHQQRRPPLHRRLASDGGHLSACPWRRGPHSRPPTGVRTRPSKPWSWEHGGKRCLRSGWDRVAEVHLLHKAGDHPFPPNAGGRGGSPAMWEAEPWLSSHSTTARLMNILEAKHRWRSVAPTRPRTSSRGKTRPTAPTRWGGQKARTLWRQVRRGGWRRRIPSK